MVVVVVVVVVVVQVVRNCFVVVLFSSVLSLVLQFRHIVWFIERQITVKTRHAFDGVVKGIGPKIH